MANENNNSMALDPDAQTKMHNNFWKSQTESIENINMRDLKLQDLPLARIKKIMKLDESVKMISAEVPILFAKAAELFISEITMRGWWCTEENKRRTLQKSDIALAASRYDQFDFLIDIVPREDVKPSPKKPIDSISAPITTQPQFQYYFQLPLVGSGSNVTTSTTLTQAPIIVNQQHMAAIPNINNNPQGQIYLQQATPLVLNSNNISQVSYAQNTPDKPLNNQSQGLLCNANSSGVQTSISYPLYLVSPSVAAGLVKSPSSISNHTTSPGNSSQITNTTPAQSVLAKNSRKQIHSPHPHLHQSNMTNVKLDVDKISSIFGINPTSPSFKFNTTKNQPSIDTSVIIPKLQEILLPSPTKHVPKMEDLTSLPSSPKHTIQLTQQQLEALLGVRIHNLASGQPSPIKLANNNSMAPPQVENNGHDNKEMHN